MRDFSVIEVLLHFGADITAINKAGKTPEDIINALQLSKNLKNKTVKIHIETIVKIYKESKEKTINHIQKILEKNAHEDLQLYLANFSNPDKLIDKNGLTLLHMVVIYSTQI